MARQLRYVVFFVSLIVSIVLAWRFEYSGDPIAEEAGTVLIVQHVWKKRANLARVKTESGTTVKADCRDRRRGERVRLVKIRGRLSGKSIYRCH